LGRSLSLILGNPRSFSHCPGLARLLQCTLEPAISDPPVNREAGMKLITAIIKPYKFDEVRDALTAIGVEGMTVTEVKGFGRQKGQTEIYRGAEYSTNLMPKLRLELVVADDMAERGIEAIQHAGRTGTIGD